jgi:TonB family protein
MARAPIKWALPPISEHVWAPVQPIDFPELNLSADPTGDLANHAFDGAKPLAPCFCGQGADGSSGTEGGLYTEPMVDKAAMPRPGNPSPTYPAVLRAAQLEGSVTAHFIVDTLGRAEPASIAFPEASHPAFAEAVRQSLLRSRYLPAIVAGHPVRQLVEQRFTFALQH